MNEFKLICNKIGANWNDALERFISDGRISNSHVNVLGMMENLVTEGFVFPKDINALLAFSKKINVNLHTIEGGWKTNFEVRANKDWELKTVDKVNYEIDKN